MPQHIEQDYTVQLDLKKLKESIGKTENELAAKVKENEMLRKSKLSNQMGTLCLKAENFAKAQSLFQQAVVNFEQFKATGEVADISFSNVWFNQANLFAAQKKYVNAI